MRDGDPAWPDERLAAAFRDRAVGRETPAQVEAATMARLKTTRPERRSQRWLALAAPLAAAIAVAAVALTSVTSTRPPAPAETDVASSVSQAIASATAPPTSVPTPRVITIEFASGPHRIFVDVVDRSGRLLRAAKANQPVSPGRQSQSIRASAVAGHPDQVQIDWFGGACDPTTRLTIGADLTSIRVESTDSRGIDTGSFCMLGVMPRGVILTFDGPVLAEDLEIAGRPPGPQFMALEALGLPVVSVEEALRHRDESLDDTELAVFGYWYRQDLEGLRIGCPSTRVASPILPGCDDVHGWLTATPEPASVSPPSSPAIQPILRNAVNMDDRGAGSDGSLLLIGHFDDHRGAICTGDLVGACRGSFVVDVVLDPSDPSIDLDRVERRFGNRQSQLDLVAKFEEAERVATDAPRGARHIVAAFAVAGADLASHEPQARAVPELIDAPVVWIVRYIDPDVGGRPVVRTKLVIDGPPDTLADRVYEVTSSGVAASGGS